MRIQLVLLGVVASLACAPERTSGDDGTHADAAGSSTDGGDFDAGSPGHRLARLGGGALTVRPGASFTLSVAVVDPYAARDVDGGPLPTRILGAPIDWTVDGVASPQSLTNVEGVATFTLTAPNAPGTFSVKASSTEAAHTAVWQIDVEAPVRHLKIIPAAPIVTLTDTVTGRAAAVTTVTARPIRLRVQASEEFDHMETPLPNEVVSFTFVTSIAGANLSEGVAETNSSGKASVTLTSGTTIGTYKVLATIAGNVAATFTVNVTTQQPICRLSAQCGTGYICNAGTCAAPSSSGCGASDQMCPIGFACSNSACAPITDFTCNQGMCPNGFSCEAGNCVVDDPQCATNSDCPTGGTCNHGLCFANAPSTLNVTGQWFTAHDFDIHAALPGWLQLTSDMAARLDAITLGQISGVPEHVRVLLQGLAQAYVPAWVARLASFLKHMSEIFGHLHVRGEMDLTAMGTNDLLYLTEDWELFRFNSSAFCPTETPPARCGDLDVETEDLAQANFATSVHPSTARLVGDQILFDRRTVNLQLAGIIAYALNQFVSSLTGHPSLQGPPGHPEQGALYSLIDCPGVAQFVLDCGYPLDITGYCQNMVAGFADEIVGQLSNIVINTNALTFVGRASTALQPGSSQYVYRLGQPTFETVTPPDGNWDGRLVGLVPDVPGRWRATRQPME